LFFGFYNLLGVFFVYGFAAWNEFAGIAEVLGFDGDLFGPLDAHEEFVLVVCVGDLLVLDLLALAQVIELSDE